MVAPDVVGRGGAPAHLGGVDDVVVQQGGGVQVLEDGGEIRQVVALVAAHAGGQDEEERPDALAAAQQDVPPHFGDEGHVGLEVGGQGRIDGGDVRLQILEQLFGGFNHQIKITYIPGEVNSLEALSRWQSSAGSQAYSMAARSLPYRATDSSTISPTRS